MSGAITWIRSPVFFNFFIRRMQEIKQTQLDIIKRKPANICSTTLLLMYMFKSIVTTPRMDTFTRDLLREINAQAIIDRFGFLCLQTQDHITFKIDEIPEDADDVIEFVTNTKGKRYRHPKAVEFDGRQTEEYPIGSHPTWQEITDTLCSDPSLLVSTRCGNNFWNGPRTALHLIVIDLMAKFTGQYFFSLDKSFLNDDYGYPKPVSWDDVMRIWSIEGIQEIVHSPSFVPHKSH
jgi:hypothetical protein